MTTTCVTGAFGYSGRYIALRLLARGDRVRTLTSSSGRESPLRERIESHPLSFEDPSALTRALHGVDALVNTYWVRFPEAGCSHPEAVEHSRILFDAARRAGVGRIVHVSITNPSADSPYSYFRGKAAVEASLAETGIPHTILRPAVFFGGADILLNNIAWMLRRFPVFGVVGDGAYRIQPIHVEDFAGLAEQETLAQGNRVVHAIGPETCSYRDLVRSIGRAVGRARPIVRMPRWVVLLLARRVGRTLGDVVLTREEVDALADDLLAVDAPSAGSTRLSEWLERHAPTLGVRYASELARRPGTLVPQRSGTAAGAP